MKNEGRNVWQEKWLIMRILLVCKALHFSYKGGIQTHVWELSQALLAQGLEVSILTAGRPALHATQREVEGRTLIELPTVPGHRIWGLQHALDELVFNLQAVRWLAKHAYAYEVIHFHGRSGLFWPVLFPCRLSHCLLTLHGLMVEEGRFRQKNVDRWVHTRIFSWVEKVAIARLPVLIAVSQDEASRIRTGFGRSEETLCVIPNGVAERESKQPPVSRWIVFAGRMEAVKGVALLPDILQGLPEDVGLYMVGAGSERPVLEKQFQIRGLTDRVVWTGAIEPEAVMAYIEKSRLLVLPSLYEPQGRVVLEAMSMGRPVVGSRVGGIPEMLTDGVEGLLAEPSKPGTFLAAIRQLLENPELAIAMGRKGREKARRIYSWTQLGREVVQVYEQFITHKELSHL
jgi:glycosyltransferase involved in cell wall biosynthesis